MLKIDSHIILDIKDAKELIEFINYICHPGYLGKLRWLIPIINTFVLTDNSVELEAKLTFMQPIIDLISEK